MKWQGIDGISASMGETLVGKGSKRPGIAHTEKFEVENDREAKGIQRIRTPVED
jgi:hypothetical protein